jgi:hypothetical protein
VMMVHYEELAGDGIKKRGGHCMGSIQGRVLTGILVVLKEE